MRIMDTRIGIGPQATPAVTNGSEMLLVAMRGTPYTPTIHHLSLPVTTTSLIVAPLHVPQAASKANLA
jgi:hypothetical protein